MAPPDGCGLRAGGDVVLPQEGLHAAGSPAGRAVGGRHDPPVVDQRPATEGTTCTATDQPNLEKVMVAFSRHLSLEVGTNPTSQA